VLGALTWEAGLVGLAIVVVVRPVTALLALVGSSTPRRHRLGIAFFGIRGMGSIYYFAHGLVAASFVDSELGWALLSWVIVLSIVLHGLASNPVVRWVERESDDF
jgi:sodium/hydrogen antiporter